MKPEIAKLLPRKAVIVVWQDHVAIHEPSWIRAEELVPACDKEPPYNVSVGWPVRVNKKTLTIAQTIGADDGTAADLLKIIRSCIVTILPVRRSIPVCRTKSK